MAEQEGGHMRRLTRSGGLTTAAIVLASGVLLAQDVTLRYAWTKGEQLKYRMTNESTVGMTGLPGIGEMTTTTLIVQDQTMTAESIGTDGAATLQTKIDSLKMNVTTPMGGMAYDSANPPAPGTDPLAEQIGAMMGSIVGQTLTMVIEPTGAIRSLTGLQKMMEGVQRSAPGGMLGMSGMAMTDDALKGTFGQGFATLPAKAIKTGDSWTSSMKLPNPAGTMTIDMNFTLKNVAGTIATIAYTQKATFVVTADTGPMQMKMGDGTGNGEITFDTKLGRMMKSTGTMSMPMTMSMAGPDGQQLDIQGSTQAKVTLQLLMQ
jgi:hypothetical protein